MAKRKWKLSNPPKKSGWYHAYYYRTFSLERAMRYYDLASNSWYSNEDKYFKLPVFGKSELDRWSHI